MPQRVTEDQRKREILQRVFTAGEEGRLWVPSVRPGPKSQISLNQMVGLGLLEVHTAYSLTEAGLKVLEGKQ